MAEIRKTRAAVLAVLVLMMAGLFFIPSRAAEPVLTLEAERGELGGTASKRGGKVGNIGKNGGEIEGTVTFRALDLPADGYYTLRVTYFSGSDDRYFILTTDSGATKLPCPSTGGFDKSGTVDAELFLTKGGFLSLGSDWYGPDLDRIDVLIPEEDGEEPDWTAARPRDETRIGGEGFALILDAANGVFSVESDGGRILSDARAECSANGILFDSRAFASHRIAASESDGNTVSFIHENHPDAPVSMTQTFFLDPENRSFLTEVTLSSPDGVSTNRISPLTVGGAGFAVPDPVFLSIPFDNDMWAEPAFTAAGQLGAETLSHEAFALFSEGTGAGVAAGSVEHDAWKTGISVRARFGEIRSLEIYGGAADGNTHDSSPHGFLSGNAVKSPRIFLTVTADWRDGLDAFGRANAEACPPKSSVGDVPFGYNSWGVLQDKVGYGDMTAVSDYIRDHLQKTWAADGAPVYVNLDSFWDFLSANDPDCGLSNDEALKAFVRRCHENGQKAGIYYTPFTAWHSDENALKASRIEGTGFSYYDAALKKSDGSGLYGKLDGGFALDPTHPAVLARLEKQLTAFIDFGFDYVKLDFMTHGALEGMHHDPAVKTGMQAYAVGMAKIREICDGKLFVNLSIAPLFPYQYADGRRISCDAFSSLDNTRHVLSCLTAGFWEKAVYPYPDPDHLVVWGRSKAGDVTEGEARARVTAGAISGTSFLVGDDLSDIEPGSEKERRIDGLFANPGIVETAKLGSAFRPWSVTPGEKYAEAFWHADGGDLWLAVFNFGGEERTFAFDLTGKLPAEGGTLSARELWRGTEAEPEENGSFVCSVPGRDAALWH
ncbi:MAG: hypothetical protein II680_02010, partial [Clostridia bacterium]|nr:hypothetical protein [Clostridia bacterium]